MKLYINQEVFTLSDNYSVYDKRQYIKQEVSTLVDNYSVYDENENIVFNVIGKLFSMGAKISLYDTIGAKISLYDTNGDELYFIKQPYLQKFEIYKGEQLVATIQPKFSLLKTKMKIESDYGDFEIIFSSLAMDFEIIHNNNVIGTVTKKWLTWGDTYELDIDESKEISFFTAIVIAIENAFMGRNKFLSDRHM